MTKISIESVNQFLEVLIMSLKQIYFYGAWLYSYNLVIPIYPYLTLTLALPYPYLTLPAL